VTIYAAGYMPTGGYDWIKSYSDTGGLYATFSAPNLRDNFGGHDHGLVVERTGSASDRNLFALHRTRVGTAPSDYYPDSPGGSLDAHTWLVEKFTDMYLGGHTTITLTNPDTASGFGNSQAWTGDLDMDLSQGNLWCNHRNGVGTSQSGFNRHHHDTGAQLNFYSNTTGVSAVPSRWFMVPNDVNFQIYGQNGVGHSLLKGPPVAWSTATTFYTASGNLQCYCANPDTGDVFIGYFNTSGVPVIDRVSSAGSLIQTYTITITGVSLPFTPDPNNTSHSKCLAAAGNMLVLNPYFANTAYTNDYGVGVWLIDIPSGTGSDQPRFNISGMGTPPLNSNIVYSFAIDPAKVGKGVFVGSIGL